MKDTENCLTRLGGKRLLIFDFDGTVADTSPLHAAAFGKVLAPFGISLNYPSIAGLKTSDALRHSLSSHGIELDDRRIADLVTEKQQLVRRIIGESLQPLPGVEEFLRWARSRYRLAMVTSGSQGTVALALRALGYDSLFDPLICADDVKEAKPDPEGFLLALRMTNMRLADALIFEDSTAGVQAAQLAGIDCWDVREAPLGLTDEMLEMSA